jgi:hypothetical protein
MDEFKYKRDKTWTKGYMEKLISFFQSINQKGGIS